MCCFRAQNGPFDLKKNVVVQTIIITFIYLFAPVIEQNFKTILTADPHLRGFLDPKWPIFPNDNFLRKPVNSLCSFHSCLSTCQKSDINLLMKY